MSGWIDWVSDFTDFLSSPDLVLLGSTISGSYLFLTEIYFSIDFSACMFAGLDEPTETSKIFPATTLLDLQQVEQDKLFFNS